MNIVVLLDARQRAARRAPYILWPVCDVWQAAGHDVEWRTRPEAPGDADLIIPHLDFTVRPARWSAALAGHPAVVNRDVVDVSKRRISEHLVGPDDAWDGPVIVKTDLNSGGLPEWRIRHGRLASVLRRLPLLDRGPAAGLGRARWLPSADYPVYASIRQVPPEAFGNPALVVEKFLPELQGDYYCLRSWVFLGDAGYNTRNFAASPVVKARAVVDKEEAPVPEEIVAARQRLGLDYGKIDYVVPAGRPPVLLDVNPTPTFRGGPQRTPEQLARAAMLAGGLARWERAQPEGSTRLVPPKSTP